ncbi:hypothetical protein CYMTET_34565 [Cymbomonas tetramitiformis]|uniref:Esterase n=1 Tax=Cymbomonas tetramitiformis TaxID=36881 RepID=A0AAE0KPU4_9CHLO|nr:hypothetical protein CYMTET_34565 [Cymbomonas tetramitiformis]
MAIFGGVAGAVYMNRKRSTVGLADKQPVMFTGFNSWSVGNSEQVMVQTELPKYDDIDWFAGYFNVPDSAFEQALAFCDAEKEIYDNNDDNDYMTQVTAKAARPPRTIACVESEQDMAGGKLQVVRLNSRPGASRRSKWKEERMIRVWTPPGYHKDMCGEKGIPVLYLNDGKNLFEDWLAHQGVSWNAGHCAGHLIGSGKLPPFMIVGVDSPGPFRSQCYLPFPPGIGINDHRPDAAKWPGGEVEPYMERIVQEMLPMINTEYGGSLERERLCFGGASFGGVCAIYTAMYYPDVFSSVLVESPSLWSGMGKFLGTMYDHEGEWAERMFMATGTLEAWEYAMEETEYATQAGQGVHGGAAQGPGETQHSPGKLPGALAVWDDLSLSDPGRGVWTQQLSAIGELQGGLDLRGAHEDLFGHPDVNAESSDPRPGYTGETKSFSASASWLGYCQTQFVQG